MFVAVALGFITGSLLVAFALALVGSLFLLVRALEHPGGGGRHNDPWIAPETAEGMA
jgi:hypothetical protein